MHKDMFVTMSNLHGERNKVTAGKIKSKEYITFSDNEESTVDLVVEHTTLISEGSSGSALLNEKLELVGINIGVDVYNYTTLYYNNHEYYKSKVIDFLLL
jgi:S1-C subfamily serine protease